MRIIRHYTGLPPDVRGAALAVGNFDGVHRGHQAVIAEAGRIARDLRVPQGVLTFEPHPSSVFRPEQPPFRLSSLRSKSRWIEPLGVDLLFMLHFDLAFASQSPERFIGEVLVQGLGARHLVVGTDFRFGHRRIGSIETLAAAGEAAGFRVSTVLPVLGADGVEISSTRIREHLRAGRPDGAAALLGHWWEAEGRVEPGDQRGRTIGFPTANVRLGDFVEPATGVYAVRAGVDEGAATQWIDGVANFGRRPTVDGKRLLLEVHLFDFTGDLYGKHLRVQLLSFLRPERKFESFAALKEQIARDSDAARGIVAVTPPVPPES